MFCDAPNKLPRNYFALLFDMLGIAPGGSRFFSVFRKFGRLATHLTRLPRAYLKLLSITDYATGESVLDGPIIFSSI